MAEALPVKMPLSTPASQTQNGRPREAGCIRFYGWDARSRTWHGPDELGEASRPDSRMLQALQAAPGSSWYGMVHCDAPGEERTRFFTLVHDLNDCAMATIYCDESKAGPAEIVVVLPSSRRDRAREDFAFEFVAFARFLGSLDAGSELEVHEAVAQAIAEADADGGRATVISINSGMWPSDLDHILALCVEKVALTMCEWLDASAGKPNRAGRG